MTSALGELNPRQRLLIDGWLPDARLERAHGWGLVATAVLEMTYLGVRFIVKAGGESDHHIAREIEAHLNWLEPWTSVGRAPVLEHCDVEAKLVVTRYLPGELVLGSAYANDPGVFRQAGELLALLHGQSAVSDRDYEAVANRRTLAWFNGGHRIASDIEARLRAEIGAWPTQEATLVPTHGDWQPRNWLTHEGVVAIIDFGRAALRPAMSDFTRLAAQDFRRAPALEKAFLDGYGSDPREPHGWHRVRVREAIGTAAWAYQVGAEGFEAQGHQMIDDVLALDGL